MNRWGVVLCLGIAAILTAGQAWAVTGHCGNCHTMHNSENTVLPGQTGPLATLLKGDCQGCHWNDAAGAANILDGLLGAGNDVPQVNANTTAGYLAGGTFFYTTTANNGHNPVDFDAGATETTPPGGSSAITLSCAGTAGCHGGAGADSWAGIKGAHHSNAGGERSGAMTALGQSYRFLRGEVYGYEDIDWEATNSDLDHNQYFGVDRDTEATDASHSISALCAECHGDFHTEVTDNANLGSPWTRHPSDFDMSRASGTEFASYGNYSVAAPLGSAVVTGPIQTPTIATDSDEAIVLCVSCHRAHGSEYANGLRWDYDAIEAGNGDGDTGCVVCHTGKD